MPRALQSLSEVITNSGYVQYHLLFQNDTVLQDNIDIIRSYKGLSSIKEKKPDDLAFYCNAYNMWSMFLAYKKLVSTDKKWKGTIAHFCSPQIIRKAT